MNPKDYTAAEWTELARQLDAKKLKGALRSAYRVEAGKALKIARKAVSQSGLQVQGNPSDLNKGVRPYIYSRGGGFMVTVKPQRGKKADKSMHRNRYGKLKPVLMWAEDGTKDRRIGRPTKSKPGKSSFGKRLRRYIRGGHSTGRMKRYAFLARTEAQEEGRIENNLFDTFQKNITRRAKRKKLI